METVPTVENGKFRIVNLLLKNNAYINLCNKEGQTPLSTACIHGYIHIVQRLLHNCAITK